MCLFYSPTVKAYCLLISLLTCTFRVTDTFQNLHAPNAVSWTKCMHTTSHDTAHIQRGKSGNFCLSLIGNQYEISARPHQFFKGILSYWSMWFYIIYIWIMINDCGLNSFGRWFILCKICIFATPVKWGVIRGHCLFFSQFPCWRRGNQESWHSASSRLAVYWPTHFSAHFLAETHAHAQQNFPHTLTSTSTSEWIKWTKKRKVCPLPREGKKKKKRKKHQIKKRKGVSSVCFSPGFCEFPLMLHILQCFKKMRVKLTVMCYWLLLGFLHCSLCVRQIY